MKKFIRIDDTGRVFAIRYGSYAVDGEIENEEANLGDIRQADGSFITPIYVPDESITQEVTFEEKVTDALERISARLDKIEAK